MHMYSLKSVPVTVPLVSYDYEVGAPESPAALVSVKL